MPFLFFSKHSPVVYKFDFSWYFASYEIIALFVFLQFSPVCSFVEHAGG